MCASTLKGAMSVCVEMGLCLIQYLAYVKVSSTKLTINYQARLVMPYLLLITADIDECLAKSVLCSHFCRNTPGTYSCECFGGYAVSPEDNTACNGM